MGAVCDRTDETALLIREWGSKDGFAQSNTRLTASRECGLPTYARISNPERLPPGSRRSRRDERRHAADRAPDYELVTRSSSTSPIMSTVPPSMDPRYLRPIPSGVASVS